MENGDQDVKDSVYRNFYVDDGLVSLPIEADAVSLMKRTQSVMKSEGRCDYTKLPKTPPGFDWDEHLSPDHFKKWTEWQSSPHRLQIVAHVS